MSQQPPSPTLPPLNTRHSRPSLDIHFLDLPSPFYAASSPFPPSTSHPDRSPSIFPFTHSKPKFFLTHNRYHHSKPSPSPSTSAWWKPSGLRSKHKNKLPPVDEEGLLSQSPVGSLAEAERWKAERVRREGRRGFLEVIALFGVGIFLLGFVGFCLRMGGVPLGDGGEGIETHMGRRTMAEMGLGPRR